MAEFKDWIDEFKRTKQLTVQTESMDLAIKNLFEYYIDHEPDSVFGRTYIQTYGLEYDLTNAIQHYFNIMLGVTVEILFSSKYVQITEITEPPIDPPEGEFVECELIEQNE